MGLSVDIALIPTSLYMVTLSLAGLFKSSNDRTRRRKKNLICFSFYLLFSFFFVFFLISLVAVGRCFPFIKFVWNTTPINDQSFDKQICYKAVP